MIPEYWTEENYLKFQNYLRSISSEKTKEFSQKLIFTKYEITGIKMPVLRSIAKQIGKTNYEDYLVHEPTTYEEVMLHGLVIATIKDEKIFYPYFKNYIKKIDNWSLCDTFCNSIKIVKKYQDKYFKEAIKLCHSNKEYIVRVGLIMILSHFILEDNLSEILDVIDNIESDKYYINMAISWLICELYINYPQPIEKYLKNNKLNKFTHNKAISKIRESFRVSQDKKDYLNTLKKG